MIKRALCLAAAIGGPMLAAGPAMADVPGLSPTLQCYTQDQNTGLDTFYFGYVNTSSSTYFLAVGNANQIFPGDPDHGQTTVFNPGTYPRTFAVTVDPAFEPSVTYTLNGASVTASTSSPPPACDSLSSTGAAILDGAGPPAAGLGQDGDFYIDTSTDTLYGPKANGSWPAPVSLVGPQGAPGTQGTVGPQGPAGPRGPAGTQGPAGPTGPAGTVVCRNTLAARLLCGTLFVPGTWSTGSVQARLMLSRRGTVYARGSARIAADHTTRSLRLRPLRTIPTGRYQLRIRVTRNGRTRSLRRTVRVA